MKQQGRADRSGPTGQKVEPNAQAINPGAVSYLGNHLGNHATDADGKPLNNHTPWSAGQGYNPPPYSTSTDGSAPGAGMVTRRSGSQGKY